MPVLIIKYTINVSINVTASFTITNFKKKLYIWTTSLWKQTFSIMYVI